MRSIRTNQHLVVPLQVKAAIQNLSQAGFIAYLVGGCVRDFILGTAPKDFDLVTDALPDDLERIFPTALPVGRSFGVFRVPFGGESSEYFEVSTFREDLEYVDHRHPKRVRFAGPLEDAKRRDFTINGLYYDPKEHRILDYVGGYEDLAQKLLRAIGDPLERFEEDALRILRAARFANRFSLKIDSDTQYAMSRKAKLIRKISPERVRDELTRIWTGPDPAKGIEILKSAQVWELLFPGQQHVAGRVLENLEPREKMPDSMLWAALWVEFNLENMDRDLQSLCDRMKLSKAIESEVRRLLVELPKFAEAFEMRESRIERFIRQDDFESLLSLEYAWIRAHHQDLLPYLFVKKRYELFIENERSGNPKKMRLITGTDLVELGFQPGPHFAEILEVVEDQALEGNLKTREEALDFVIQYFSNV